MPGLLSAAPDWSSSAKLLSGSSPPSKLMSSPASFATSKICMLPCWIRLPATQTIPLQTNLKRQRQQPIALKDLCSIVNVQHDLASLGRSGSRTLTADRGFKLRHKADQEARGKLKQFKGSNVSTELCLQPGSYQNHQKNGMHAFCRAALRGAHR